PAAVAEPRNPMRWTLPTCCARAARGHATAAPPSSVMNSRRLIQSPGRHVPVPCREWQRQEPSRCANLWTARPAWVALPGDRQVLRRPISVSRNSHCDGTLPFLEGRSSSERRVSKFGDICDGGQEVFKGQHGNGLAQVIQRRVGHYDQGFGPLLSKASEGGIKFAWFEVNETNGHADGVCLGC